MLFAGSRPACKVRDYISSTMCTGILAKRYRRLLLPLKRLLFLACLIKRFPLLNNLAVVEYLLNWPKDMSYNEFDMYIQDIMI